MEEILDDFKTVDDSEQNFALASKGKRFTNYLIDLVGYMILSGVIGVLIGILFYDESDFYAEETIDFSNAIAEWLFGALIITTYYTCLEYFFKGKTLGKLITKTRAVTVDNNQLNFIDAFKRSLCRLIPFEAFSFLGDDALGWHDTIPNTKVIEDIGWKEIQNQMKL